MLRFTTALFRTKATGYGISPFSLFLIQNKGHKQTRRAADRYNALSATTKAQLKSLARQHPSFVKPRLFVYHSFIRSRFNKLEGRAAVRMKKISALWQRRKAEIASKPRL